MKGLFVALICATVSFDGVYVKGSPLPLDVDTPKVDTAEGDSTVESTDVREAKALPVYGLRQGGLINQKPGINPFLQSSQQHQTPSGGIYNQQLGVNPVGPHVQPSGGVIQQQLGVNPVAKPVVGSSLQGGYINQQSGAKPVVGSHLQGGYVNQQSGVRPEVGSSLQGGYINQQSGVKPVVGSSLQGGYINQQSGVKPVVGSQGGPINQQPSVSNPFLQGSQQHQTASPGLTTVKPGVNPFLQGAQQYPQHQIPSGVQIPGRSVNQQTKVLPVDSQVHVSHDTVTEKITSRNSEVHVKDSVNDKPIEILSQNSDVYPDGSHFNVWESANGIKVQEEGTVKVNGEVQIQSVSGSISYTDADGTPIHLTYIADENGFQPQGDHLPTPPPIPQAIARALEYVAAHPYVEEEYIKEPAKTALLNEELPVVEVA